MPNNLDQPDIPVKRILDIDISVIDLPQLLQAIDGLIRRGRPALINNVNIHACNLAFEQPAFREVLNASDVVFCDGFGVKLAGWLTGNRLGQRMTPPDWIDDLFRLCVLNNYSVYFLGDQAAVVERFALVVRERHPELRIAGCRDGFFDMKDEMVMAEVASSDADVVITGMGMPRQELWAAEAGRQMQKGVFIATGALFRWYTGYEQRAPKWITNCGLEWLARLLTRPRRNFKRYALGIPLFYWRVIFRHWLRTGGAGRG